MVIKKLNLKLSETALDGVVLGMKGDKLNLSNVEYTMQYKALQLITNTEMGTKWRRWRFETLSGRSRNAPNNVSGRLGRNNVKWIKKNIT